VNRRSASAGPGGRQPPTPYSAGAAPGDDHVRQREKRERASGDETPEPSPGVVLKRSSSIPLDASGTRCADPPGHDDTVLVKPRTEGDAEIDDQEPEEDGRHEISWLRLPNDPA